MLCLNEAPPHGVTAEIPDSSGLLHLVCIPQPAQGCGLWKIPPSLHSGGMKRKIMGAPIVKATHHLFLIQLKVVGGPVY